MRRIYNPIRNALAALGLLVVLVTLTPFIKWYAGVLSGPGYEPSGDVLILFGADGPNTGFIGSASYWRSLYAVRAWREGGFHSIVVSGGGGVAESIGRFLEFEHVPAGKILLETRSSSTRENAVFTAALVRGMPGRKVLLTSDFHTFRSVRTLAKAGAQVTPRPIPYAVKRANNWMDRWPVMLEMCVETAKIAGYWVRGWI